MKETCVFWKVIYKEYIEKHEREKKIRMFSTLGKAQRFIINQANRYPWRENYKESYEKNGEFKVVFDIKSNNVTYTEEYTLTAYFEGEIV